MLWFVLKIHILMWDPYESNKNCCEFCLPSSSVYDHSCGVFKVVIQCCIEVARFITPIVHSLLPARRSPLCILVYLLLPA